MITIRKPLCFSEIGRKGNQEDFLFPISASVNDRIFILCDGMGGHDNGEVASRVAATTLGNFLSSRQKVCREVDPAVFEEGLSAAYDALDVIDTNSLKKPGTTMTCLCLNLDNYLMAHIGDSRIYHIRPSLFNPETGRGGIIYQSEDHSLVNDLLKAGELTEEEARDFPQKNIITRAMQPHLERRYKADVAVFNDIKAGDYFFICCDGILEQLSNEMLCSILANQKLNDEEKMAEIKAVCDSRTRDNYSCWLIPIESVSFSNSTINSDVILADEDRIVTDEDLILVDTEQDSLSDKPESEESTLDAEAILPPSPRRKRRPLLLLCDIVFICLAILWCVYFGLTYKSSKIPPVITPSEQKIEENLKNKKGHHELLKNLPEEEFPDTIQIKRCLL